MGGNNKKRKNNRNKKNKERGFIKPDDAAEKEITQEDDIEDKDDIDSEEEQYDDCHLKRSSSENDSDSDDDKPPKRKKKKKQPVVDESTGKKGQKSIRQMKKEKHAQRLADAQIASKDQLKTQCLNYLSQWKHDKQNWKFMKVKQVWLFKNKFSSKLVPNESWPTLLEYFESAMGNIRKLLLEDANKVIKQMDDWKEKNGNQENKEDSDEETEAKEDSKPDETTYKRARDLIQCLQE